MRLYVHVVRLIILCLMACVPTHVSAQVNTTDITDIYVFGDSTSDNGAGIAHINAICKNPLLGLVACGKARQSVSLGAAFYAGKSISDGPVAMEVMANLLGKQLRPAYENSIVGSLRGENFALIGAKATGADIQSLSAQVASFTSQHAQADPKALYVFFIGANDVLAAVDKGDATLVDSAIGDIQRHMRTLADRGARRFLVYKLLDLSELPRFAGKDAATLGRAREYSNRFNGGIDGLTVPAATLYRFNTPVFWGFLKQFAFTWQVNYKGGCVAEASALADQVKASQAADVVIEPRYLTGCDASGLKNRLYFDNMHLSGYANQLLGQASVDFVVEQLTGTCAAHTWGAEAPGSPPRGLLGSIYTIYNTWIGKREYFRLANLSHGDPPSPAYWYFPTNEHDNSYWQYLGNTAPTSVCGTAFRSQMNIWDARHLNYGVSLGDFAKAKAGDKFFIYNSFINRVEYFTFLDPYGTGFYWYFPVDGASDNFWWRRD
ncbi:hypothetical protein GCM10027431_08560 [Lysobacter rhizosphaerae]